jgi:hypothetical protein
MFDRRCLWFVLLCCIAFGLSSCTGNSGLDAITISPTTASLVVGGPTLQMTATGTFGNASHSSTKNITGLTSWTSAIAGVATVNSAGVVTAVGAGITTITGTAQGFAGPVSSTATITVTGGGGGTGGGVASITIIPSSQSVQSPGQTSQFIAIGTTTSGATEDISGMVTWVSSSTQIATIDKTGLATAVGQGTTNITAIAVNSNGSVVTGSAAFTVVGGSVEQVTALTIYPGQQSATSQAQQSQFFVLGAEAGGLLYDVTAQVVWKSSDTSVATVGTAGSGTPGLATAVGSGSTTITATFTNKDGSQQVGMATFSVSIGAAQEPLISINVVPGSITVSNRGMTGQYLAFGTYSTTPTVRDLTDKVTWISSLPEVASISSAGTPGESGGLATSMGYTGFTNIYAEASNPDGTVVLSNPVLFTCSDALTSICEQSEAHPQFATITVYNAGENTTNWLVTAPTDTGVPNLIHCGPGWKGSGGSVCTGTYETGSTIVLTESPTGTGFGGWNSGDGVAFPGGVCIPAAGTTLLTSPTCTLTLNSDTSVGAIFY